MERFSISEVIEQAVRTEKLGYEFYSVMAEKFKKDKKLNKLFETLAVKEKQHEKRFAELKDKIKDEEIEGWEEVSEYLRAIVESEFFLGKNKSLPSLRNIKTMAGAVKFALGFEKETLLYYHNLRDIVKEKYVIDEIVQEEKQHIIWLSDFRRTLK